LFTFVKFNLKFLNLKKKILYIKINIIDSVTVGPGFNPNGLARSILILGLDRFSSLTE